MSNIKLKLKAWLSISLITFLVLILVCLGLPALFVILQIPSFEIGEGAFWIIRWQNNVDGNIDDRKPVPDLLNGLFGKIFADSCYVSQKLASQMLEDFGIQFFAKPRRNMKNKLMRLNDKLLSRKRSIIETINDQLKNISQIEHSRHRSLINFCVNVLCGLIAYCQRLRRRRRLSTKKTKPPSRLAFAAICLTRTQVI